MGILHLEEMCRALVRRAARGVQRKAEEGETAHVRAAELSACACEVMRPPKDLPPAMSGKLGHEPRRFGHRGAHRGLGELRRIGALAALLHVGELIAKRRDAALREPVGDRRHEGMGHAGAGAVGEHVAGACAARVLQEPRDAPRLVDGDGHGFRRHGRQAVGAA